MSTQRITLSIRGKVQGVFFRQSALEQARRLGLAGWVRNLSNGDVEAMAEGSAEALNAFVTWCHRGPRQARVDSVEVNESAGSEPLVGFTIHP